MLRQGARRVLPCRGSWHSLQDYAIGEVNQAEFTNLRTRDAAARALVGSTASAPKPIDWDAWESKISHKTSFICLKEFHAQQSAILDAILAEDHLAAVKGQEEGWELFDDAVTSCKKSVEKSEDILRNGARALWISFHNPPISLVSQSEWLDADQYWQAFVEKHQFYHNHICSAVEDPESKEYDAKNKADLIKKWETFDGRGTTRQNNKDLGQRPSFEYYDVFRGALVEHMIFYLTKTGGDARFFPENMPVQWFAEIYDSRFKVLNVLQRRKRADHEATWKRKAVHDFHPEDLEHDGEGYWAKLIGRESAATELTVARLMGNFILFSDGYVPVQTGTAAYRALQLDGGRGQFFSLGGDVHALFYKPAGEDLPLPDPTESFNALSDHVAMTGRRFSPGYGEALQIFCDTLESRKEGLGGLWLTAPGETTKDAFLRRLKKSDPAFDIYTAYAEEHSERWSGAKALTVADALAEMPEIERKYNLECAEYDNILFGLSDEFSAASKAEVENLSKLANSGVLATEVDNGNFVALDGATKVKSAALVESMKEFDDQRDKALEVILATKTALDRKK